VVVAHPDDETFGCGSLLAHAVEQGMETFVCCATRGEAGEPAAGSGIRREDLAAHREAELRAAAALLGVSEVTVLDWRDSDMVGEPAPGSFVAAAFDEVVDAVRRQIDRLRPDIVVTLDATDGHRDHVRARDATLVAFDEATWRATCCYLQCLPRPLMREWAALLQAADPESTYLEDVERLGTPEELFHAVLDTSAFEERRWEAIRLHRSQVSPYDAMPTDLRRRFLCSERLQLVRPAWEGGPVESTLRIPVR
jgi:LmbE family N-acetylglucosaminyl deacetylase